MYTMRVSPYKDEEYSYECLDHIRAKSVEEAYELWQKQLPQGGGFCTIYTQLGLKIIELKKGSNDFSFKPNYITMNVSISIEPF